MSALYEGILCNCGGELELERDGKFATSRCLECGQTRTEGELFQCRGQGCTALLFKGGRSGKVPVNLASGANHFTDCPAAQQFRRRR